MADNDLTIQLEDIFSDIAPEPGESGDSSDHMGIVAELLDSNVDFNALTEPSAAEPAVSEASASTQPEREVDGKQDGAELEDAVAAIFGGELLSRRETAESGMLEAPQRGTTELKEAGVRPLRGSSREAAPGGARVGFLAALPHVSLVSLGLLLILLLIGFMWAVPVAWWVLRVLYLVVCVIALVSTVMRWSFNASLPRALREAEEMRAKAVRAQAQLEERIEELTRANASLEKSAGHISNVASLISRSLSSVRQPDELMQEAVNLVCELFDLDYVGLFLMDESGRWAVLHCLATLQSTGQADGFGHPMLSQGYQLEVGGRSMVGRCTARARVLVAPDMDAETYHRDYTLLPGARSEMTLPLRSSDQMLGALDLQSSSSHVLAQESIDVFQMVADLLGFAIDQAQGFADLKARLDAAEDFQRHFKRHYERAQQTEFPFNAVPFRYERTRSPETTRGDQTLSEVERAMAQKELIVQPGAGDGTDHAVLVAPITLRDEVMGALGFHEEHRRQWTADEIALVRDVTTQVALAVENTRLFEQTQTAAEQEALLNEMLRDLATALNVQAIIQTIQDPLARLAPFDHMSVALLDEEMSTLEVFHATSEQPEDVHVLPKGQVVSPEGSLTGQIINTWKTTVIDLADPGLVSEEIELLRQAGMQTCMVIPLVYGPDLLGSLNLAHSSPNAYTATDVPLLERVAQLTTIALENARLFGQLSHRAVQLQTAAQVSQAATSILNLDQLLDQTVELIRSRFNLYYVGLFMVDAANEWAVLHAGTGEAGRVQLEQGHRLRIGGDSMIGWCVAHAQPRIALDVGQEAIRFENPALPSTRSELALPLISRGETIGALSVQSTRPAAFSREDLTTLRTMASQLANAIQNARFVEQTQKALAETEALYLASSELNTAQTYEDVLAALRRHTLAGHRAHEVSLNLFDRFWTGDRMPEWIEELARWTQLPAEAVSSRQPMSAFPSAAQLLRPDQATLIEDIAAEPRLDDNTRALYLDRLGAKSTIFVPLVVGGQWIGFVNAVYQEPTIFPEAEVRRLMALSGQAAVAVQSLRQLQEIRARARREALIREITEKIRATTDLETILQTTITQVSEALRVSHGAIRLGAEAPDHQSEEESTPAPHEGKDGQE